MSAYGPNHTMMFSDGRRNPRLVRALGWSFVVEASTVACMVGTVSTISASQWGSSAYVLSVLVAGIAVLGIRRLSLRPLGPAAAIVDLGTLAPIFGIINNPMQRGMPVIIATLLLWVFLEAVRVFLRRHETPLTAPVSLTIFAGVAIAADGRSTPGLSTPLFLAAWAVLEVLWILIDHRLFGRLSVKFRLTRRQKALAFLLCAALFVSLVGSAVWNIVTVQYYGAVTTMHALAAEGKVLYCRMERWRFLGVDISFVGFPGPRSCFDTEAELTPGG